MALNSVALTADGDYFIMNVKQAPGQPDFYGTAFIQGSTFGSGTVTFKASIDGGTTKITLDDATGTAYSATGNKVIPVRFAAVTNSNSQLVKLYASISGSTNPNVTVYVVDNRAS